MGTGLNSKNLIKAINTYACSALSYSFGIISWTTTDLAALQRKIRTMLTKHNKHHPKSSKERTELPRHLGGRGIVDLSNRMSQEIEGLRKYFLSKAASSELHRVVCVADSSTPLKLQQDHLETVEHSAESKMQKLIGKPLHGRHQNEVNHDYVDISASNYWLTSGRLFPETEGFMLAIQDQVIPTRNYMRYIAKDASVADDSCRYGCATHETIQHITGGCQKFAGTEYKNRHDAVAKILHQELALKHQLLTSKRIPYYNNHPDAVLENEHHKLY